MSFGQPGVGHVWRHFLISLLLARKYKHKITVVAMDVYEQKNFPLEHVKAVVDNMGKRMDFAVAAADTNLTVKEWIEAWREKDEGIPRTFVINAQGRVAWIGHPKDLHEVLPPILKGTWDIKAASEKVVAQRNTDEYLWRLDSLAGDRLHRFNGDYYMLDDLGKPDSALLVINEIVRQEPRMRYAPVVAAFTFDALLKTNPQKAYAYGKEVITTPSYEGLPAYGPIIASIKDCSKKITIPPEIYGLGAEAYRSRIAQCPYPELYDDPAIYNTMANWYWLAGDKSKALKARRKAKKLAGKIEVNLAKSGL